MILGTVVYIKYMSRLPRSPILIMAGTSLPLPDVDIKILPFSAMTFAMTFRNYNGLPKKYIHISFYIDLCHATIRQKNN